MSPAAVPTGLPQPLGSDSQPYLSVVATARNDDHGGNMLGRMQLFVSGLLEHCRRRALAAELVLVEWNPPLDRPRLREALSWPSPSGPCRVRIIEVPPDVHHRFKYADRLPLFQMIAKNAGIRRARGRFVLATNIDILFPHELVDYLATRQLASGRHYRVDRHDVPAGVPVDADLDETLAFCCRNVMRRYTRDGTRSTADGRHTRVYHPLYGLLDRCPPKLYALLTAPLHLIRGARRSRPLAALREIPGLVRRQLAASVPLQPAHLHINACGDFTLMAREHWHDLRGYPELEMYSFNLDTLLCHAAHHSALREVRLLPPLCVYHVDHADGFTPEAGPALLRRVETSGIPVVSGEECANLAVEMRVQGRPVVFNHEGWGLLHDLLPEATFP